MLQICSGKCTECIFTKDRTISKEEMIETVKKCLTNEKPYYCHMQEEKLVCHGFYKRFQHTGAIKRAMELQDMEIISEDKMQSHEQGFLV